MASIPRRVLTSAATAGLAPPSTRYSPFKELGSGGVAVFGGRIVSREKDQRVAGEQRWRTYADLVTNTSIIAAGVRFFLNIVSGVDWQLTPADDKKSGEAQANADLVDSIIHEMDTPWRRVARRGSMYRFHGFGIQEWTAKRRADGKIGLLDVESRPQHTISRWNVDEKGTVQGVWQTPPQTGEMIYLPRSKIMYMVEDSLTDSPEGLGLFRHLVDPYVRLQKYLTLEGQGYERDLRGIPIGRIPYQALDSAVQAGKITEVQRRAITSVLENFVKVQSKSEDTSLVLDSAPYVVDTDSGQSISGVMQYGLELLQGQSPDFSGLASAVGRLNLEMARIIGVEHLLLGSEGGSANRALSEDKSRNFYLTVNGSLDEFADAANKDIVGPICDLNGIKEELRPKLSHSDVAARSVSEITTALRDMATAGAVLSPTDPAIDDVRDLLGISPSEQPSPEMLGMMQGQGGPTPPVSGQPGDVQPPKPNGGMPPGVGGPKP